ncbi:dnaj subfamily b member 5 [Nannochloropsis oceanica]
MRITKKIWDAASGKFLHTTVDKDIPIKKGWKNGTKITFEREGDELPGVIPADIVFVLNTKPHPRFEREGDDLVYTATVPLEQALTGVEVTIQTLDGRTLKVSEPHVTPGTVKILRGEGMPLQKSPDRKGNLKVKFNIVFPTLTDSQKREIRAVLKGGRG